MADARGYFKVANGLPEHHKLVDAGGDAGWLHICALAYCSRNLTDGLVPLPVLGQLSDRRSPKKLASKLVEVGLWHTAGHDCPRCPEVPDGKFYIHDYLQHQTSAEQAHITSQARSIAGQRGGQAKQIAKQIAKQNASKPLAEEEVEQEVEVEQASKDSSPRKRGGQVDPDFERFWRIYPRKVARGAALKAWSRAIRDGTAPAAILGALEFYAMERKGLDPVYTKHPATWLNAACWMDEPDPAYRPLSLPSEAADVQPKSYAEQMADIERKIGLGL